jgi:DNA-directed RNA polymerase subunit H (RpoH/RPB5)
MVLELEEEEPGNILGEPLSEKVESLDLLHFLKFDRREIAAVGRVVFRASRSKAGDIFEPPSKTIVQQLESEGEGYQGILVRWRPRRGSLFYEHIGTGEGYIVSPVAFRDGRFRIAFLGSQRQIRLFLGKVEGRALPFKVSSVMDASFSPDSPLGVLTEKQRNVIVSAFRLGYYDLPRKLDSDQLANQLSLVNSTVVEHIRKAERRMLAEMLGE